MRGCRAQGDSMTKEELEQFREQISRALKIGAIDSAVYTFAPELLKEAGDLLAYP